MKALLAALAILAIPADAFACRCFSGQSLDQEVKSHDVIFSGQVSNIQQIQKESELLITFNVKRLIKGEVGATTSVTISKNLSNCGYMNPFFLKHNIYVVFAYWTSDGLETSRCSPNKLGPPSDIAVDAMQQSS